eukprot:CAMPEP_0198705410 /NCGR_PEP_ID=MMETSP1468-20131203/390416_1 /TAXON_ID=1461545 /ORGANISM="Mantoniella sp, Strain CCMP1436" /LENGTH=68 /DNA_ID=CAMNT_0044464277 /DNA_START=598 /DNA_END=804 /DNA_ORIENTATION=-
MRVHVSAAAHVPSPAFSAILLGVTLLGITHTPRHSVHASSACAGVHPIPAAAAATAGCSSSAPHPSGL